VTSVRDLGATTLALLLVVAITCACGHSKPTVTGAELYAQVQALQTTGRATVGAVEVRKEVIATCKGGDPGRDVDCTLALLLGERFTVTDHVPERRPPKQEGEDRSSSMLMSGVVVGVALAAAGGLVYGVATCEFPGCKAVFGVPIVLVGGGALFVLVGD
jgi:hypothetical protein